MSDHYIFSNGRLKRKENTIYFQTSDGVQKALPVERVDNFHIFGEVDLNSKLFTLLTNYGVCLHFYNYYGYYTGTYYPRTKNISGFTVVQQSAHYLDPQKRYYLASAFVNSGIHHMLRNLRRYKEKTQSYQDIIKVEMMQIPNRNTIHELMGIEGRVRQVYYRSFNEILKSDFHFDKRNKKPPTDPLNALISFGNSLMYTTVLSEIYKTVLDPTISFLHEPSSKRFSLSLDLAEIFKPLLVDSLIISVVNNRTIKKEHFEDVEGMVFLNDEGKKRFIKEWEKKLATTIKHRILKRKVSYRRFIRLECYKIIKHLLGDESYRPLKAWW